MFSLPGCIIPMEPAHGAPVSKIKVEIEKKEKMLLWHKFSGLPGAVPWGKKLEKNTFMLKNYLFLLFVCFLYPSLLFLCLTMVFFLVISFGV